MRQQFVLRLRAGKIADSRRLVAEQHDGECVAGDLRRQGLRLRAAGEHRSDETFVDQ